MSPRRSLLMAAAVAACCLAGAPSCSHEDDRISAPVSPVSPVKQAAAKEPLTLPEKPLQTDVSAALMTVYPLFLGCAGGMLGYSRVSIVVAGPTGKVTSAKVIDGDYAGTHEGACIEKAVMRAVFPKFALPELTILFRFFLDSEETGIEVFKIPLENQRLTIHRERGGI